jgi:hypothetical protein
LIAATPRDASDIEKSHCPSFEGMATIAAACIAFGETSKMH